MWQRLSKRERILLIVMAIAAVLFVGYRFVWLPLLGSRAGMLAEMERNRILLETARQAQATLPAEMERVEQAREAYNKASAVFSADMCDGGALVNLGLDAERLGLRITGYHSLKIRVHEHYLELPVLFEMQGCYPALLAFIDGIEKRSTIPNVIQIRRMLLEQVKEGRAAGAEEVKAQLYLVFYSDVSPRSRLAMAEIASWKLGRVDTFTQAPVVSPYAEVKARGDFGQPEGNESNPATEPQGGFPVQPRVTGDPNRSTQPSGTGVDSVLPPPLPVTTPQESIPPDPSLDG